MKIFVIRLLKALNFIVAGLLLLSYLGMYTNPQHITLPAFGGLVYVYLLLVNLLFVLLWLFIKARYAFISVLVILVGWVHVKHFIQWNNPADNGEGGVKLLTYNVRLFNHFNWDKSGSTLQRIKDFLKKEGADIVCLQEFHMQDKGQEEMLNKFQLGQNTVYRHVEEIAKNRGRVMALATFSTYPVVARGVIDFQNSANGCIFSDIVLDDDTVRIYNCHLQSVRLGSQVSDYLNNLLEEGYNSGQVKKIISRLNKAYRKRAFQMTDLIKHISNSTYPVILTGDLNDTPFSYTYKLVSENLQDGFMQAGKGLGTTYRTNLMPLRIDYVFFSDYFKATDFRVKKKVNFSDHYPVSIYLKKDTLKGMQ